MSGVQILAGLLWVRAPGTGARGPKVWKTDERELWKHATRAVSSEVEHFVDSEEVGSSKLSRRTEDECERDGQPRGEKTHVETAGKSSRRVKAGGGAAAVQVGSTRRGSCASARRSAIRETYNDLANCVDEWPARVP